MERWKAIGIAAFSYGTLASSFLSRAVKLASDEGSNVACMQPPSVSPIPSNRKAIPRTAIATPCSYALPRRYSIVDSPIQQLAEEGVTIPDLRSPHPQSPCNLLQECRITDWRPPRTH